MHFYVLEKIRDFFTLRPSDLNTTLTYVLMDNFLSLFQCRFDWRQIIVKP